MIGRGELDCLCVEDPFYDLAARPARRNHPVNRLVVDEPDPVRPILVEKLCVELLKVSMERLGPGILSPKMGCCAATVAVYDGQGPAQHVPVQIQRMEQAH